MLLNWKPGNLITGVPAVKAKINLSVMDPIAEANLCHCPSNRRSPDQSIFAAAKRVKIHLIAMEPTKHSNKKEPSTNGALFY
jgi:hypothetical protein